jgi:polysaccharide export outer membrane protein
MRLKSFFCVLLALVFFTSCKVIQPSLMLKTEKDFQFSKFSDSLILENYKIAPNDEISLRVFANDGFKLIDITTQSTGAIARNTIDEIVDYEGKVKLPLLGKVKLSGMTLRQAQTFLEKEYESQYIKPFIQLRIINKRVIVFPGTVGAARVVNLVNNNTTLFEAIAMAGGISTDGKAYRIKLIRRPSPEDKPEVFLIDLSTIDGVKAGNTTVLANDIIYVEPRPRFGQKVLQEITPYLSIITTSLTLFLLLK